MKYIYKRVKVLVPHCPICKEQLIGNGSSIAPYQCSCGVWKNSWEKPFEYELVKKKGEKLPENSE